MSDLDALATAIVTGDRATAVRITDEAIGAGHDPLTILDARTTAMTTAMQVIGRRVQGGEIQVPEMLTYARAMKEATALLEPRLAHAGIRPIATAVVGTVPGVSTTSARTWWR